MTAIISKQNSKLGKVDNFSLTPLTTCSKEACSTCGKDCYAAKFYRIYPTVKNAWNTNTELALNDLVTLEKDITGSLTRSKPALFRIHVGGDFPTRKYAQMWARIAHRFPDTKFLAFTKRWDIVEEMHFPGNMKLVYSAWPGMQAPPSGHPIAWMDDGTENRIPADAHICMGGHNGITCSTCKACWNLDKKDVVFLKH